MFNELSLELKNEDKLNKVSFQHYDLEEEIGELTLWLVMHTWDVFVITYICQLIRSAIRPLEISDERVRLIHTFIFSFERCLCQIAMAAFYIQGGVVAVFVMRTILGLVWYFVVGRVDVNFCIFLENYARGKSSLLSVALYTTVTFIGCKIVWLSIKFLCSHMVLGELETHCDVVERCSSDLKVSVWLGAIIEGLLTFTMRFYALYVEVYPLSQSIIERIFFLNFVNCYGMDYTGSYGSPITAYVLLYHCEGIYPIPFVIVYVIAPIMGSMIALILVLNYFPVERTEEENFAEEPTLLPQSDHEELPTFDKSRQKS